ncbi:MAG: hypothetical protein WA865_04910 [Spirulinaceae cyanobacterium]
MLEKLFLAATITLALNFFISSNPTGVVKSSPRINTVETPEQPTPYLLVNNNNRNRP